MSQTFHTPNRKQGHKRPAVSYSYISSTPCNNVIVKSHNISLSRIDTASSSSGGEIKKISVISANPPLKTNLENTRKRKKRSQKNRTKNTIRKRKKTSLIKTDNEWETASEQPLEELSDDTQEHSPKKKRHHKPICNLFEYSTTPEQIRDVAIEYNFRQESPILGSSRRIRPTLKRNDNREYDKLSPVLNLPSTDARDVSPEITQKFVTASDTPICNLFEYSTSPEQIRDVAIGYNFRQESPILGSSRRIRPTLKRNDNREYNELLPVSNLPSTDARDVSPEITQKRVSASNSDEPIFHKESNIKTYPALLKQKESSSNLLRRQFPTAANELQWDNFINKFCNYKTQNVTPPSLRKAFESSISDVSSPLDISSVSVSSLSDINPEPCPEGMECIRGYWDEHSRKWITLRSECNPEQEKLSGRTTKTCGKYKGKEKEKRTTSQFAHFAQGLRKPILFRDQCNIEQDKQYQACSINKRKTKTYQKYSEKEKGKTTVSQSGDSTQRFRKRSSFRKQRNFEQENQCEVDKRKTRIHKKCKNKEKGQTTQQQENDVYDCYEKRYIDVETDDGNVERMTFSVFRHKAKMNKLKE